jgi:hypothetical protein
MGRRVEQGGEDAVTIAVPGTIRVVEGVFDDAHDQAVCSATAIGRRRIYAGQVRAVGEGFIPIEDHMFGDTTEEVDVSSMSFGYRFVAVKPAIFQHQSAEGGDAWTFRVGLSFDGGV